MGHSPQSVNPKAGSRIIILHQNAGSMDRDNQGGDDHDGEAALYL